MTTRPLVALCLALLLPALAGCGGSMATRIVPVGAGDSRVETAWYTLTVPTSRGWTVDPVDATKSVWLHQDAAMGKSRQVSLVVMDAAAEGIVAGSLEELLAEYEKLAREGATMGGMAREDARSEAVEIGGKTFHRIVHAAVARQEAMADRNHVAGVYLYLPNADDFSRYLLVNVKDETAERLGESDLLETDLPAMLRTLRPRPKAWAALGA
jgi:hypothetical protein